MTAPFYSEPPRNLAESYADAFSDACKHVETLIGKGVTGKTLQSAVQMRDRLGDRLCELQGAHTCLVPVTDDGDPDHPHDKPAADTALN